MAKDMTDLERPLNPEQLQEIKEFYVLNKFITMLTTFTDHDKIRFTRGTKPVQNRFNFLDILRSEAKESRPGILPKDTKFESYIGQAVINLSNTPLDQNQIKALGKGPIFCPTPGPPDKSQIWLHLKEFVEFFNRDKKEVADPLYNPSIIDFIYQIVQEDLTETTKNKEVQQKFKPKSSWRPYPPNRALEIFQRSVKQEILKSKPCKTKQ